MRNFFAWLDAVGWIIVWFRILQAFAHYAEFFECPGDPSGMGNHDWWRKTSGRLCLNCGEYRRRRWFASELVMEYTYHRNPNLHGPSHSDIVEQWLKSNEQSRRTPIDSVTPFR